MVRRVARHIAVIVVSMLCGSVIAQPANKYWVVFSDKGNGIPSMGAVMPQSISYREALQFIQPQALARRAKVLAPEALVDAADLPVYKPYMTIIEKLGGVIVQQSRWLNAASVLLAPEAIPAIAKLSFVHDVRPVGSFRGWRLEPSSIQQQGTLGKMTAMDYGLSQNQLQMINVPVLHAMGVTGRRVVIGMLDSGFRWKDIEALRTRHVIGEYDFVFNDSITANQQQDVADQDFHGTLTMSVLGGYKPGKLIGPAFDADFLLAKTEYNPTETRQEEDSWAAGIEWMESRGVDVVSSSLGYNTFDLPDSGYFWLHGDFDGHTSVTARAAQRAVRLGVVVCTAMGNEGNDDSGIGTMLTPADADTVISVGAVNYSHVLANFSSQGPTSDLRIKPDVVAPGVAVAGAYVPGPDIYGAMNGTSLATPLVAGVATLLLSVRPELTPVQVRDALRATADPITNPTRFPASPNNFTGWGHVDAFKAALSFGPIFSNQPIVGEEESQSVVAIIVISKFGIKPNSVVLHYAPDSNDVFAPLPMQLDSAMFFPTSGRYLATIPSMPYGTSLHFTIDVQDSGGNSYASPPVVTSNSWQMLYGIPGLGGGARTIPTGYELKQNFPNPFNGHTNIIYDLPRSEQIRVIVYDVLGRKVVTLVDGVQEAGAASSRAPLFLDASNLSSGVYFVRMITPSFSKTITIVLLR